MIHNTDSLIVFTEFGYKLMNFKGVVKKEEIFSESEGKIMNVSSLNQFIVLYTDQNYIRILDISRREIK